MGQDCIQIRFFGAEDLISKVAALAAFAVHEPAHFRQTFEAPAGSLREPQS
jgi:hypothetical protein